MRISDWSSDVCSSDLTRRSLRANRRGTSRTASGPTENSRPGTCTVSRRVPVQGMWTRWRSEEHTSELQSLMRISYAVFCLKKKNTETNRQLQYNRRQENNIP